MKNITYFTLSCVLIILISGCAGYKPIFSPTNLKFEISDYTITGDQTIGNKIYSKLYRASNVKQNEKNIMNIDISIDVLKNKKATIKNSSGKILEYKIFLDTTIEVSDSLTDDNLFNDCINPFLFKIVPILNDLVAIILPLFIIVSSVLPPPTSTYRKLL